MTAGSVLLGLDTFLGPLFFGLGANRKVNALCNYEAWGKLLGLSPSLPHYSAPDISWNQRRAKCSGSHALLRTGSSSLLARVRTPPVDPLRRDSGRQSECAPTGQARKSRSPDSKAAYPARSAWASCNISLLDRNTIARRSARRPCRQWPALGFLRTSAGHPELQPAFAQHHLQEVGTVRAPACARQLPLTVPYPADCWAVWRQACRLRVESGTNHVRRSQPCDSASCLRSARKPP